MQYRIITSDRCPCGVCAGELISPAEIEETGSLRDALSAMRSARGSWNQEDLPQGSSYPMSWDPMREWISISGTHYNGGCDGIVAAEVSFHFVSPARVTPSSFRRIGRLLGVKL